MIASIFAVAVLGATPELNLQNVGLQMHQRGLVGLVTASKRSHVHVSIESETKELELQRGTLVTGLNSGAEIVVAKERVCRAPCNEDVEINSGTNYFVSGEDVPGIK